MIEHLFGVSNVTIGLAAVGSGDYALAILCAVISIVLADVARPLI